MSYLDEDFSSCSWEQDPFESDEDYEDRIEDLDDFLDYNN